MRGTGAAGDRLIILAALTVLVGLTWTWLIWLQGRMNPSMADMPGMMMPDAAVWNPPHFLLMLAMWAVMMVGMMTPSASPMILVYARVAAQAQGTAFASTAWFAGGYLLAWLLFSVVATFAQDGLDHALSPMMALNSRAAAGAFLIAAGLYQWTPLKNICLSHCRAPLAFIQRHGGFQPGRSAALRLGLVHGFYCIGCCWALMALLFAGGVMNLGLIAALMMFVLLEKLLPLGHRFSQAAGLVAIMAGGWIALT
jgi:predicted metal-binding membrane protein